MNGHDFILCGTILVALPSGALWWPDKRLLVVSDLHLGKSGRIARIGGTLLPPYETDDTLTRLDADIAALKPQTVICLGDSFDDLAAAETIAETHTLWLSRLMAGRRWLWIEGNHDPGPVNLGGVHLIQHVEGPFTFRHIAVPNATGEISGHYHPKARVAAGLARACFLHDDQRAILPAYGTYTGGLHCDTPELTALMRPGARALLLGTRVVAIPMPGAQRAASSSTVSR